MYVQAKEGKKPRECSPDYRKE